MTKLKNITTKIFLSLIIIVTLLFAQTGILFKNNQFQSSISTQISAIALSNSSDREEPTDTFSNNTFSQTTNGSTSTSSSSYTGNEKIPSPKSWERVNQSGTITENLLTGVVNIEQQNLNQLAKSYGIAPNDVNQIGVYKDNTYALMINSTNNNAVRYGYRSSTVTLDANSFYSISVSFYTGNDSNSTPVASLVLSGDDFGAESSAILGAQTDKNWGTATFWIKTNQTKTTKVQLELYLGMPSVAGSTASTSSGYVLFKNVTLNKYAKNFFDSQNKDTMDYTKHSLNKLVDISYSNITSGNGFVKDGDFTSTTYLSQGANWQSEITGNSTVAIVNSSYENYGVTTPFTNKRVNDEKVLMIFNRANQNGSASGYAVSQDITIKQHTTYRISFWAKTNASSISAKLVPATTNGNTYDPATITSASSSTSDLTNDWNEYAFYVTGNALTDTTVKLKLGLETSSNTADKYVFYDNVTSQQVSTKDRDNSSNVSTITTTKLNINKSNSSDSIQNGYFNTIESADINVTYPLSVANWTYNGITSSLNLHGIINVADSTFNASKKDFGSPVNPVSNADSGKYGNVLMLYNKDDSIQSYTTSSTFSASASTAYKLSIDICTQRQNNFGGANIYLKNSDGVIISQILDINTNGIMKTYTIYFNNYATSQTLNLTIGFGREDNKARGWAYFDNCEFEKASEKIIDIEENSYTKVVNLSKAIDDDTNAFYSDSFSNYENKEISATNKSNTPLYWNGEVKAEIVNEDETTTKLDGNDIKSGIINIDNISKVLPTKVAGDINADFLMIYSPTDTYYVQKNKLKMQLSSSSYYKLTVKAKTVDLTQNDENKKTVNKAVVPFGASIILDNIDQSFVGINTNGKWEATDDDWLDYTFYINTTDAIDLSINLGLGSTNGWTSGYAFFDDIVVEKMEVDDYELALKLDQEDVNKKDRVISVVNTTQNTEDNNTTNNTTYTESLAWLSIPTVIIGIGIIIAIAGYCIKKYLNSRPVKVKVTSNYDRSSTLLKELDHRNYKTSLNHRLKLLHEELSQTEKYLEDEKAEHQKQMEAYQTAKEIAEQDKSIQLETPNKKYTDFERTVQELENNIASIKADIQILEEEQETLKSKEKRMRKDDLKGNKITKRK